jgi:hypothetical protein
MKKIIMLAIAGAALSPFSLFGLDQEPELAAGRDFLNARQPVAARDAFAAVVAQNPTHEKAHAMLAITRLASLYADPRANALLDAWQVDAEGRDIYEWTAGLPELNWDLPPPGSTTGDLQTFLIGVLLSELLIAEHHLAQVVSPSFTLRLKQENFGLEPDPFADELVVDRADVLLIRAVIKLAESALRLGIASNDLSVSFAAMRQLVDGDLLTAARVLNDNPSLLTLANGQQRADAIEALEAAIALYEEVSPLIRVTGRTDRLFVLDPDEWWREEEFRDELATLTAALEGPVEIGDEGAPVLVDLSPLRSDQGPDLRGLLPVFVGNKAAEGTLPDPTFGGVLPDQEVEDVEEWLESNGLLLTKRPKFIWAYHRLVLEPGQDAWLEAEAEALEPFVYEWRKNGVTLPGENGPVLTLGNVSVATAGYYTAIAFNDFGEAVSPEIELIVTVPLDVALDTPGRVWSVTNSGWIGQTLVSHDGQDAARTGLVLHTGHGEMTTTVSGPGVITFWWKLERGYDWWERMEFRVGGLVYRSLNWGTDWQQETVELGEGIHILQWNYALSEASTGWLDQVVISPSGGSIFDTWAQGLPQGQQGREDDPGGLGLPNLLRYAFGMDPLNPARSQLPRIGQQDVAVGPGVQKRLSLTYTRRKDDPNLQYIIEASGDMITWQTLAGAETIFDDANGETETVVVIDDRPLSSESKRFLRLRVEG